MTGDIKDEKGQFKKGVSGNPTGRPKTSKLTQKDKDALCDMVKEHIKEPNLLSDTLAFLLQKANDTNEVFKYFKEFASYLLPKLSSVKQEVTQETTYTVRIAGFESISLIDKEKPLEAIDHEVTLDGLGDEVIEEVIDEELL